MPYQTAFRGVMQLRPPLVRLAAYWDRMETQPGVYDFSILDWLLASTPPNTRVILEVGMKAPRWPEYYIPAWLEQANALPDGARVSDEPRLRSAVLDFVRALVERYRDAPAIAYWQVENEPLDATGPRHWTIGPDLLAQEIDLVRALDGRQRPVLATTFVPTNPVQQLPGLTTGLTRHVQVLLSQADILGLDIYPVRAHSVLGQTLFFRWPPFVWQHQLRMAQQTALAAGKKVWATEVEAEPWLLTQLVYLNRLPSVEIEPAETDFVLSELQADGFQTVLLWGAEYWYMRLARYGDSHWWDAMRPLVS